MNKKGVALRRFALTLGAALALGIATVGVYAYKFFTERPGEDALRFIPSTASVVVTLDLSPSAGQAGVFKKIDDALARNHMDQQYNELISGMASEFNLDRDFADCVERAGAFAIFDIKSMDGEKPELAIIVGLKNPGRAEEIIRNIGRKFELGSQTAYAMEKGDAYLSIIGSHLILSPSKKALGDALDVYSGKKPSILTNTEFAKARADLDSDSNVMAFVNVREIANTQIDEAKAKEMVGAFGWAGIGISLRDGGISFKSGVAYESSKVPALDKLASIKPLESNLYSMLPGGAYMVSAGSDTSASLEFVRDIVADFAPDAVNLKTIDRDIRKEIGMGIEDGILPAFKGDSVLALYPSKGTSTGAELLFVIGDQNGADPAKLADAVRRTLGTKYSSSTRKGPLMVALKGDGSRWQMAPEVQEEMVKSITENPPAEFDIQPLVDGKTVTYAKVGNAVIIATSKTLLDRALASYTTGNDSLVGDSSIMPSINAAVPDAQSVMVLDISRIAACADSMMRYDKMDPDASKMVKGVVDMLKGLTTPLHGSSAIGKNHIGASFFMPMDYDGLINFIGGLMEKAKEGQGNPGQAPPPVVK